MLRTPPRFGLPSSPFTPSRSRWCGSSRLPATRSRYAYFPRALPSTPSYSCHDRATYYRPAFQTWHDLRMGTDDACHV
ncbi:MAG: hypothetical protein LBC74_00735 [Planctomycetaceae bacterium]|nr:hypothetical protein [Planctomycetaceae bacterium]